MPGCRASALRRVQATRWVKLTLPPMAARSWFAMRRFSSSTRTGTSRTEVAVGTVRLRSMFSTTRAAAPRKAWEPAEATGAVAPGAALVAGAAAGGTGVPDRLTGGSPVKKPFQESPTDSGNSWNWRNFSSISQAFGPKRDASSGVGSVTKRLPGR